jgi:DNA-directed RNA polymerase specialized sigma24 family protein
LPEFRGDAKVTTWLYRITERVARESRRKDRFRRWFSLARQAEIEGTISPPI